MFNGTTRLLAIAIAVNLACVGCKPHNPLWPAEPITAHASTRSTKSSDAPVDDNLAALPDFSQLAATCGNVMVNVTIVAKRAIGIHREPGWLHSHECARRREASEVTVKFNDRREFAARVIGVDARTDIAVIKIDARDLPVAKLGDPSKLRPGQWVVAIGAPFGFENSVTVGVVSGTARSLPENDYVPFIQTDVAVNPGNSGGPLFSLQGEVIGINSQIYSRSGGYMGLSFAIPIDVASKVEQRIHGAHVPVAVWDTYQNRCTFLLREAPVPYVTNEDLPPGVREHLPWHDALWVERSTQDRSGAL